MKSISKVVTSVCILSCCTLAGVAEQKGATEQKGDVEVVARFVPEQNSDVEIIARFVAFPKEKIDEIVTANVIKPLTVDDLSTLLKQGDGRIISSPRVIAKSGSESIVRSAVVYRAPQDFDIEAGPMKGADTASVVVTKPQDWEDFDIGVSLKVTPLISDDGTRIYIDCWSELVENFEWETTQVSCLDSNSEKTSVDIAIPSMKLISCATRLTMQSGTTVIVSGGMSDREEQEEIFILLTCTVLNSGVMVEEESSKK